MAFTQNPKPVQNGNAKSIPQPQGTPPMPRYGGHTTNNGNGKPGVS